MSKQAFSAEPAGAFPPAERCRFAGISYPVIVVFLFAAFVFQLWYHTYRAGQFLRLNRVDEAIAEGREAVRLAPGDPRTHLSLGLALVRAEQKDEGRREFEQAGELAKSQTVFRNVEVRAQQELRRLD
jgi:tetratricopeptide (TPR) repeat protein